MVDPQRVTAYVDGELDAAARADFERALAADAALRRAVERERALRERLADAYAPVLDEPVPAALQALLRPAAPVVDLAAARAAKAAPARRWQAREWGAMAACLVLGVALGLGGAWRGGTQDGAVLARAPDGTLVAQGALANALGGALAADGPAAGGIAIGLTFPARGGAYCRSFAVGAAAGLACRRDGTWQVQALLPGAAAPGAPDAYRPAGTAVPPALLQAIEQQRDGEVLDAAAERAARDRGWRR